VGRVEARPDPTRLPQRRVSLADVTNAVRASQSLTGAGFMETASARLDVQNDTRLRIEDAVATLSNIAIPSSPAPPPTSISRGQEASAPRGGRAPAAVPSSSVVRIRIGDVGEVVFAVEPPVGAALYDGRPAVFAQVNKLPGADTIRVTEQVEQALDDLRAALPAGALIEPPVFRQATFVSTSVRSVGRAMLIGTILVIVILVLFLRYGRLAAISLTAIPLSILTAGAVLIFFGASIYGMTLGGLAIAVGEVVDDAIVDVENVWRRLRENVKRSPTASRGGAGGITRNPRLSRLRDNHRRDCAHPGAVAWRHRGTDLLAAGARVHPGHFGIAAGRADGHAGHVRVAVASVGRT